MIPLKPNWLYLILASLLLSGCNDWNSGGSSPSTASQSVSPPPSQPAPPPPSQSAPPPPPASGPLPRVKSPVAECLAASLSQGGSSSGGIEGTGRTKGVITAVGENSLTVNEIVFDASHAVVFVNGVCATLADLRVGVTATVEGQVNVATHSGTAFTIYADESVSGVINSIDSTTGTLNVNGQAVVLTSATLFGDDVQPAQLNAFSQGDMIAVSGSLRQDGTLVATRIHRWPAAAYESVAGVVTSIDSTSGLLHVSGVQVRYTNSLLVGFSDEAIHIGDYIRALGQALGNTDGYSGATGIDAAAIQRAVVPAPDPRKDIVLAGAVSTARTADDFDVMNQPVKIYSSTRFAGLALNWTDWVNLGPSGYFVTVFGSLDPSGYVVADLVVPQMVPDLAFTGPVTAIDRATRTVEVMGIPVRLSGAYSYLEREGLAVNFDALNVGDGLAVEGEGLDTGLVDVLIASQRAPSAGVSISGFGWSLFKPSHRPILVMFDGIQADTTNAQFLWQGEASVFSANSADLFWNYNHKGWVFVRVEGIWTGDHVDASKVYWNDPMCCE
jgi:hypothetical protein